MGRSSKEKAQENRASIVETACRMFRESGVENVSVAQIMAANDMTVGGFYKHFESKDALVSEAFALAFDQSRGGWQQVRQRADSQCEHPGTAMVRQYLHNRTSPLHCPMLMFASTVATGEVGQACAAAYALGTKTLFDSFLDATAPASADTPQSIPDQNKAMVLFAAMLGARLLAQSVGDEPWVRALKDAVNQAAGAESS